MPAAHVENESPRPSRGVRRAFAAAVLTYTAAGLSLVPFYRHQINPDGIALISVAQKYLRGDFYHALNGSFGPLFSWLLMPFLASGLEPLLSAKLLSLIIGMAVMAGAYALSRRFDMADGTKKIVFFSLVPIILYYAFSVITADMLLACCLLFYLALICDGRYAENRSAGPLSGALGGAAYLCKAYAFFFFIVHFLVFNAFHYVRMGSRERREAVVRNLIWGYALFFLASGPWIALISAKYHRPSVGVAMHYITRYIGTESCRNPIPDWGLLKPPDETAVSIADDPCYIPMKPWNPFRSREDFQAYLREVLYNSALALRIYMGLSTLSAAVVIAYILLVLLPSRSAVPREKVLYPLVTVALYSMGYILAIVNERYFWFTHIILLLMTGQLLDFSLPRRLPDSRRNGAVRILFALTFAAMPADYLIHNMHSGQDVYTAAKRLEGVHYIRGNIASNREWHNSLYIAYHLQSKYYGIPRRRKDREGLLPQLRHDHIDYYLVWGEDRDAFSSLSRCAELTGGKVPGLGVYSLKEGDERPRL